MRTDLDLPGDVQAMLEAAAFLRAHQGRADRSLKDALARVEALEWPYHLHRDEERIWEEVLDRAAAGASVMHPQAGRLLDWAHQVVRTVDATAMPQWTPTWQWDAVCEAAFLTLVYARLQLTGFRPAIQAAHSAPGGREGLEMPVWPLVGHPAARQEARALQQAAGAAGRPTEDVTAAWVACVRPYARLLCYMQHATNFQDETEERLDRLERQVQRLDDRDERHTFGESF